MSPTETATESPRRLRRRSSARTVALAAGALVATLLAVRNARQSPLVLVGPFPPPPPVSVESRPAAMWPFGGPMVIGSHVVWGTGSHVLSRPLAGGKPVTLLAPSADEERSILAWDHADLIVATWRPGQARRNWRVPLDGRPRTPAPEQPPQGGAVSWHRRGPAVSRVSIGLPGLPPFAAYVSVAVTEPVTQMPGDVLVADRPGGAATRLVEVPVGEPAPRGFLTVQGRHVYGIWAAAPEQRTLASGGGDPYDTTGRCRSEVRRIDLRTGEPRTLASGSGLWSGLHIQGGDLHWFDHMGQANALPLSAAGTSAPPRRPAPWAAVWNGRRYWTEVDQCGDANDPWREPACEGRLLSSALDGSDVRREWRWTETGVEQRNRPRPVAHAAGLFISIRWPSAETSTLMRLPPGGARPGKMDQVCALPPGQCRVLAAGPHVYVVVDDGRAGAGAGIAGATAMGGGTARGAATTSAPAGRPAGGRDWMKRARQWLWGPQEPGIYRLTGPAAAGPRQENAQ